MPDIKLSLKPLQDAIWRTHETSGCRFLVAPLDGELDQELSQQASDIMGNLNSMAFARLVAPRVIRGWEGVGDAGQPAVCNEANIELFVKHHGITIMPWVIRQARSLDHYRLAEVDAAKKG